MEIRPIDEKWKFQVCSVDRSGFKIAPPQQIKRTYYKNRPWKYCVVIIKWWDGEMEGYERCIFLYDCFSVERWVEKMNYYDWLYAHQWEVIHEMVTNDHEEVKTTIRKYMYPTTNHHEDVKYTL
jgi:hypothetical protein